MPVVISARNLNKEIINTIWIYSLQITQETDCTAETQTNRKKENKL